MILKKRRLLAMADFAGHFVSELTGDRSRPAQAIYAATVSSWIAEAEWYQVLPTALEMI